jgi:hypothetical protein
VPSECNGETAQFYPHYIVRAYEAAKDLGGLKTATPCIRHNGTGPAIVDCYCPEFVAVVMPMRLTTTDEDPAWVRAPVAKAKPDLKAVA